MTAVGLVLLFAAGWLCGWWSFRRRAWAVSQRQALIVAGPRPVVADGYNPARPARRRRSPDEQPFWQHFPKREPRPVFDQSPRR